MSKVAIADGHTIFRSGLHRLLADEADISVAGEARNGIETLALVRTRSFDLLLLDITMQRRSGLEVIESVRQASPHLPVLVLSTYPARPAGAR